LVPYTVCATILAWRLSRGDVTRRLRVAVGSLEAITPVPDGLRDPALTFRAALRGAAGLRAASPGEVAAEGAPIDATILVSEDGLRLYVESVADSADAPTPQCWARAFLRLLTGMGHDPDALVTTHALLSEAEQDLILHHLNSYRVPGIRYRTLAGPFEEQAERTPHAVALEDEAGDRLSYLELNTRANQLAHFLLGAGAGPGTRVGICLTRGISQVVAIYAAVKTGAAYVPLDVELPDGRLGYMLADTAPLHVLTDTACRHRIPDGGWQVHDVESADMPWDSSAVTNPVIAGTAAALQHILYTSGSTGPPDVDAAPVPFRRRRRRAVQDITGVRRLGLGAFLAALPRGEAGHLSPRGAP
jgi:non-ribosomal peptide synthetase component F